MRIFLADSQMKVRSALRLLLEQEVGITVVGEAANAADLFAQAGAARPDLVLLAWELPGLANGQAACADLHGLQSQPSVVVLSGRPEAGPLAIGAGADGFVYKGDPPEQLLGALREVRRDFR
ncbi:MAG: response regulator [Chloroflexota bacterium]